MRVLICMLLLILAGCQSSKVTVDYDTSADFSNIKSYRWADKTSGVEQGFDPLLAQRVQTAVRSNLSAKGLSEASGNPNVLLRYYVGSHTETQESKTRAGIGFGSAGGSSAIGLGLSIPLGGDKVVKQAQIVVDFMNPASGKLLWRGTNRVSIGENDSPEEITAMIDKAVAEIFAKFPPQASAK